MDIAAPSNANFEADEYDDLVAWHSKATESQLSAPADALPIRNVHTAAVKIQQLSRTANSTLIVAIGKAACSRISLELQRKDCMRVGVCVVPGKAKVCNMHYVGCAAFCVKY